MDDATRAGDHAAAGRDLAHQTPFVRTVGVISLSVLKAITDRTLGRKVPTSYWSCVARTAPISCNPKVVLVTMKPGYKCWPDASTMSSYF